MSQVSPPIPGFAPRRAAAELLSAVLHRNRPLDEQLEGPHARRELADLSERDRALARRIVTTVLRRLGTLRHVLCALLDRGLPPNAPRIECALLTGAAQLLFLEIPDHAAVDLSVRLVQGDLRDARYAGLVNAVLRRVARTGVEMLAQCDALKLDAPAWLMARWIANYGERGARAIAQAHAVDPPLDLTVRSDPEEWATRLHGRTLPTGSVRLPIFGSIPTLPGYAEGSWWVQDAAAALPARLFGDLRNRSALDLCAAPGGKTAQLALAGADVTAVDRSKSRMVRLVENLGRLRLDAASAIAPAEEWQPECGRDGFDAVLVDAPCTSTGTIRRNPDVLWRKTPADVDTLSSLQKRLLIHAINLASPRGTIVYCTCSLEPEECEDVIEAVLQQEERVRRHPITETELPGLEGLVTARGDLRTLPLHWPDDDPRMAGLGGFYAARLERS